MSVDAVTQKIISKIQEGANFILANFANPDMVGHTGNRQAAIVALQAVDRNLGLIYEATQKAGAALVITADHGNVEAIFDTRSGGINKEHSMNPVPFILAAPCFLRSKILVKGYVELAEIVPEGVLSDVSPTILEIMGVAKPAEMSAESLVPILLKQIQP